MGSFRDGRCEQDSLGLLSFQSFKDKLSNKVFLPIVVVGVSFLSVTTAVLVMMA